MSPPEFPLKQRRTDILEKVKSTNSAANAGFQIIEVDEDKEDDMYYSEWVRRAMFLFPIAAAASVISAYRYWKLQFAQFLLLRSMGMDMNARIFFGIVDLIISAPIHFKSVLDSISMLNPVPKRPHLKLQGNAVPTVDILITTCREATNICLDTARAAIHIDYPLSQFRVIVTDDGANPDLHAGVLELARSKPDAQLYYTARVKGKDDRHKAGNLNHAMRFARKLPGGASEFVMGLDADMIPMRDILRAQMPHLLLDGKMGLTCPAATCYNVPVNDPCLQSQTVHNKWEEFSRDRVGDAWCTGSGWLARRCAIDELGGVPMQMIGEDVFMSTGISNLGWQTAYINQSLQFGLVPNTYRTHLKQHRRWNLGGLFIGLDKNLGLWGKNIRGLSWVQRMWWFYYPVRTMTMPIMTAFLFTGPYFMWSGVPLTVYATDKDLKVLAQASALSFICSFIMKCHMALKIGSYRATMMEQCNNIWIAPYHTVTQLKTYILPNWLGGELLTFIPTGSMPNELHERDAKRRVSLYDRLRSILLQDGAIFHLTYTLVCTFSVATVVARAHHQFPDHGADFGIYLLTHLGWMPVGWLFSFFACLVPIVYAVFPPTMAEREELLERDAGTGAAWPKAGRRRTEWVFQVLGFEKLHIITFSYALGILYYFSKW